MDECRALLEFSNELNLHFSEEIVDGMYSLLEGGMSPDSLVQLLRDIRSELSEDARR